MRELVLNHTTLASSGEHDSIAWLCGLAAGIEALVGAGLTRKVLRTCLWPYEINCMGGGSLPDAYLSLLKKGGRARESGAYLLSLNTKTPLLDGVASGVSNRFHSCEGKTLPGKDGEPLLLCALTNWVAVGFPSERAWDADRLCVDFLEMLEDGAFEDAQEEIDNLARAEHAVAIIDRCRDRARLDCTSPVELWTRREELFPHLSFGLDVEDHLAELNPGLLSTLVNRLADLHDSAAAWPGAGGPEPPWTCRVTDESKSVKKTPKWRDARRFRSATGELLLFLQHARFGEAERIHLRLDASAREIEIGYVGHHLPTKRFPK